MARSQNRPFGYPQNPPSRSPQMTRTTNDPTRNCSFGPERWLGDLGLEVHSALPFATLNTKALLSGLTLPIDSRFGSSIARDKVQHATSVLEKVTRTVQTVSVDLSGAPDKVPCAQTLNTSGFASKQIKTSRLRKLQHHCST